MGFFDDLPSKVADIVLLPVTVPLEIINRVVDPGGMISGKGYEEQDK